jgi:tetratricopeptide (TPR) repeat protein
MPSDPLPSLPAIPSIWGNVPQRLKNFTGREDVLARLRETVSRKVTVVLPHALQGMGGVGKTALAIEYAHRYRSEYDLVWWVAADQRTLARASLAGLARRLELPSATGKSVDGAADAALEALRLGRPYGRWLVIFDNADQPEELRDVIPTGDGHVLITSRNPRWEVAATKLEVDVFARHESIEFLKKRIPGGIDDRQADELAEELGDLPLALEQAGACQAETGMAVGTYLRLLKDEVGKILGVGKPLEYPLSMTAAWRVSVSQLGERLPSAVVLLRTCAFFSPEPIPQEVFQHGAQAPDTQISDLTADPIQLAQAIGELSRFALVRIDRRMIIVHRLVQALLREELNETERERYRHDVHVILAASSPKGPDDTAVWPRYDELVAHVLSGTTDLPSCKAPAVRAFTLEVVRYLYRYADFGTSYSLAERLIQQWTVDSGPEADVVIDAQRHLGNALREMGRYSEAYAADSETLTLSRRILTERNPLTLALRNSFGADLRAHGDFSKARELDEESLTLHADVFGATSPQTMRVMNNLALDYGLNSEYESSRAQHQRTFILRRDATAGVSPNEILSSWSGLARALRLCGNFRAARDVGTDAWNYGQETLNNDHYLTVQAVIDLSIALRLLANSFDEALDLSEETYTRCNALFGPSNPFTLAAATSLTNIQRTTGRIDDAHTLAKDTVARYPDVYGPDHPFSYGCSGNLALMRRVTGDREGARSLNEAALAGLDARLGRDHHYSLTAAMNLASDLYELGDTGRALELSRDTLTRMRKMMGEDHPVTLGCAANMVVDLRAEGCDEEAEQLSQDTQARYRRTLGERHPDTVAATEGRRLDFDFDPPPI